MATTPSNSGGDDEDDRESVGSGAEDAEEDANDGEEEEGEEEVEGDGEEEEEEGEEEEGEEMDEDGDEEAEDFGSQRPKVLRKTPLPDEEEEAEGGGDDEASSEEDEAPPTHDSRKPAAAPAPAPAKKAPPVAPAAAPPPEAKKKSGTLSQATLVDKLKPAPKKPDAAPAAPADASKGPPDASRPRGGKAVTKPKPAPAASSGASTASTASVKSKGKQKAVAATGKAKVTATKPATAAKRFEQSEDEEDGVSGEEAEAEACMNRPGEGNLAHQLPTLQDSHPDVHMEADAAREREAANGGGREAPPRHSGPPAKQVIARVDPAAWQQTAVFKAVGLAHRWYKHAHQAIVHQRTEGHEGDATPFEVPFVHYVEKGANNRAAFQKQLLEAHPEKFVALVRIAAASATTGGYADNLYHASIPITVVDDDSSADLIRKFKESKPPDSALGSNPRVHWPLEPKVVESAYLEPNCPLPSHLNPKNVPKDDPKGSPKYVVMPGQNQIPNMEEWTHVSATKPRAPKAKAQQQQQPCGVEGAKRQKTNQATLSFGAAAPGAAGAVVAAVGEPAGAPAGAPAPAAEDAAGEASPSSAAGALVVASPDAPSGADQRLAEFHQLIHKYHVIDVADKKKVTMTLHPSKNRVVVCEWR